MAAWKIGILIDTMHQDLVALKAQNYSVYVNCQDWHDATYGRPSNDTYMSASPRWTPGPHSVGTLWSYDVYVDGAVSRGKFRVEVAHPGFRNSWPPQKRGCAAKAHCGTIYVTANAL